jgi:hypothetical protein
MPEEEKKSALAQLIELGNKPGGKIKQRLALRSHEEQGFMAGDPYTDLRLELDNELQKIMFQEFCEQAGFPQKPSYPMEDFKKLLGECPAFAQYLNYYLYFGARFAASRYGAHGPASPGCNDIVVELPPPTIHRADWFDAGICTELWHLLDTDKGRPVCTALAFLDGFGEEGYHTHFELWLRGFHLAALRPALERGTDGLRPHPRRSGEDVSRQQDFEEIQRGLLKWAQSRYDFYLNLEARNGKRTWVEQWKISPWREGCWTINNPIAARCALLDFYWLAKILRADVSARGLVTYSSHSWLYHLAMKQPLEDRNSILRLEEVLRSVFGYACDLIQNAVEIGENNQDLDNPLLPEAKHSWRTVYDVELDELRTQRSEWRIDPDAPVLEPTNWKPCIKNRWSRRIVTGEDVSNLVGVAFSGGGIRSATFNLGVLQRLQELDLLRQVDYLSTVSGGGFIGSWLAGNVRRTRYWMSRLTSWDKSIEHLRSYSDYLAPHTGVLSADTWTMWGTWFRNAFLIQLNSFLWLAALLVLVLVMEPVFQSAAQGSLKLVTPWALDLLLLLIGILVGSSLQELVKKPAGPRKPVGRLTATKEILAALFAWLGSFAIASILWGQAKALGEHALSYKDILFDYGRSWPASEVSLIALIGVTIFFLGNLWWIAYNCFDVTRRVSKIEIAGWSALAMVSSAAVSYLTLSGLVRLYGEFLSHSGGSCPEGLFSDFVYCAHADWFAFAFGPPLAMLAVTISIMIFIGFVGRDSEDWVREWWSRYGAKISMFGAGVLLLTLAAVFAPLWLNQFLRAHWWGTIKAGAIVAWLGSVVSGLIAGKSPRTGSDAGETSPTLEWVAWIGGLLFVIGAVAGASTLVYSVLGNIIMDKPDLYFHNINVFVSSGYRVLWISLGSLVTLAFLCSWRFDLNIFGLNQFYRNRLVRCYLGATRWQPGKRRPQRFTTFDPDDDMPLSSLRATKKICRTCKEKSICDDAAFCGESFRGPLPLINCTLNLGGSADLTIHSRQSASFLLSPFYCGAMRPNMGYVPTEEFDEGGITLGQAVAVSGAAASPNMGYNTSPLVSVLLTLFNVRLGWWFPNPGKAYNKHSQLDVLNLVGELVGIANEDGKFVNISDGGHFENLGIYELIRRRARVIIAGDAECDPGLTFGSLGNLVRICQTDFGAKIDIDVTSLRKQAKTGISRAHCAVGKITYSNGIAGYLIYIKASVTGDEDVGVEQYRSEHPTFPHESTANQFFAEEQFEAYRRLGDHNTERTFRDARNASDPFEIARKLFDLWVPASFSNESFLSHAKAFDQLWDRFRTDPKLEALLNELTGYSLHAPANPSPISAEELCACMELIQLMENAFLDLRLDDFWDHPDNRGWAMFFTMCAKSPRFQEVWKKVHHTYGIRFEHFCHQHLALPEDRPIVRV